MKFIHKALRRRRFHAQSESVDWNILWAVHSETLGFFSQIAVWVWIILQQISVFSVCFPVDHFQLSWKSHKYFLIKLCRFYFDTSLSNWVFFGIFNFHLGCKRTTLIRMEWKVQRNIEWQFFRSSARTYQIPSAKLEFWIKYFLLNCVPFEMSMVIFIFPCHTDQRSPRPIRGSSRKGTKITNVQL